MKIRVLGCSGGIGGVRRTTSILVNDDILIDCGTGVMDLELEALEKIRHVFLTHTHLDHVASLPLMLDSVSDKYENHSLTVHLSKESDQVIREDLFNWRLWPNFFDFGDGSAPAIVSEIMRLGETRSIGSVEFKMLPAKHSVPAVGYLVRSEAGGSLAFSGDCSSNDELWAALNELPSLDKLIIECSYPAEEEELSKKAKHYCSTSLASDLKKLQHQPEIFISHLKAGNEELIMQQLIDLLPALNISRLRNRQSFAL